MDKKNTQWFGGTRITAVEFRNFVAHVYKDDDEYNLRQGTYEYDALTLVVEGERGSKTVSIREGVAPDVLVDLDNVRFVDYCKDCYNETKKDRV